MARTAAVNMLVVGEPVYLFNVRLFTASAFNLDVLTGNPMALWMSMILVGFQVLFPYAPPLLQVFQTVGPDLASWLAILARWAWPSFSPWKRKMPCCGVSMFRGCE